MWDQIRTQTISAVLTALIIVVGVAIWQSVTRGGLIRALGGATSAEVEAIESRLFELADIRLAVKHRTVTQDQAQASGEETIFEGVVCADGWVPSGAEFYDTYVVDGEVRRKYIRLCMQLAAN